MICRALIQSCQDCIRGPNPREDRSSLARASFISKRPPFLWDAESVGNDFFAHRDKSPGILVKVAALAKPTRSSHRVTAASRWRPSRAKRRAATPVPFWTFNKPSQSCWQTESAPSCRPQADLTNSGTQVFIGSFGTPFARRVVTASAAPLARDRLGRRTRSWPAPRCASSDGRDERMCEPHASINYFAPGRDRVCGPCV